MEKKGSAKAHWLQRVGQLVIKHFFDILRGSQCEDRLQETHNVVVLHFSGYRR